MPPHIFAYGASRNAPIRLKVRGLPIEAGVGRTDDRYHIVDDDDVAAQILEYDRNQGGAQLFRHLSPEELEDALESAGEATTAIEAGDADHILDMLLVAEREVYDSRVAVIEAIEERNRIVVEQRSQTADDMGMLHPDDIVTVHGGDQEAADVGD